MLTSSGNSIKFWSDNFLDLIQEIPINGSNGSSTLSWNNDGQFLASISQGSNDVSFYAVSGKSACVRDIVNIVDEPNSLQFANVSPRFLSIAGSKGNLVIWDIKSKSRKKTFSIPNVNASLKIAFSQSDSHVAVGTSNGEGYFISNVYNTVSKPVRLFPKDHSVSALQYSSLSKSLLGVGGTNGSIAIVDHNTGSIIKAFPNSHSAPAAALSFSPSNHLLFLSAGYDKKLKSYDVVSKRELLSHACPSPLSSLCFLDNGHHVALGTMAGEIFLHDLRSFEVPVASVSAYQTPVTCLKIQPKGEVKLSGRSAGLSSVRKATKEKPKDNSLHPAKITTEAATPASPPKSPTMRPSPSLELFSPVRLKCASPGERVPSPKSVTPLMLKNQTIQDSFEIFSPPRKSSQLDSTSMKENIDKSDLFRNGDQEDALNISQSLAQTSEKWMNSSQRLILDDLLSPVRNQSPQGSGSPLTKLDSLCKTREQNDVPSAKQTKRKNGSKVFSPDSRQLTTSLGKFSPELNPENIQSRNGLISPIDFQSRSCKTDLNVAFAVEGIGVQHGTFKDVESSSDVPRKTSKERESLANNNSDYFTLESSTRNEKAELNDSVGKLSDDSSLLFRNLAASQFMPVQDTQIMKDITHKITQDFNDLIKTGNDPCPTCGKNLGTEKSDLDTDSLQKYINNALQDYKFDTNQRFMNLNYLIIKQFFTLQREMKRLIKENSINEDLLLENERLRQEVELLRNTH